MPTKYFVVDAFTDRPFAGNPAAVVPLDRWPDETWLRNVAAEMNLSETAFTVPTADGYHLRWLTPAVEVDLCGHATLAAAKVLAPDGGTLAFETRSGRLTAEVMADGITLDFPLKPATPADPPPGLAAALGVTPVHVGRNQFDYLVEVADEAAVRAASPDFRKLAAVECRGVIVTARSDDPGYDFVSRFFAPAAGVDEDPVTGSAHCCLADHWGRRLGWAAMVGYQASARGGVVRVEVVGDRVMLGGRAVVVAEGVLYPEAAG